MEQVNSPMSPIADAIHHRQGLITMLLRRVSNIATAEDLADEALARVVAFESKRNKDNVFPWMVTIALNLLKDRRKREERFHRRMPAIFYSTPRQSPVQDVVSRELEGALEKALESLNEREREAFKMVRLDGMTCQEVAAALGTSAGNVRSIVFRARLKLSSRLASFAA